MTTEKVEELIRREEVFEGNEYRQQVYQRVQKKIPEESGKPLESAGWRKVGRTILRWEILSSNRTSDSNRGKEEKWRETCSVHLR